MAIEPLLSRAGAAVSAMPAPPRAATAQQAPRLADEAPAAPVEAGQVRRVVEDINRQLEAAAQNLRFSVDDSTGKTVVRVVDSSTGDVIRQVPSEEVLAISRSIDRLQGLLFDKEA
jgi:flagellar protein FlaG